jgi:hypothetical protein
MSRVVIGELGEYFFDLGTPGPALEDFPKWNHSVLGIVGNSPVASDRKLGILVNVVVFSRLILCETCLDDDG